MRILTDQASRERKLSSRAVFAIFQILTVNRDVAELLERKGLDHEALESLCDFAFIEAERREAPGRKKASGDQ